MKAYWRSGGIAPRNVDLGTIWRWVVSLMLRPLYPQGKIPWYLLDRRVGEPQSLSGHGGEEKNSQPLPGLESPIIQSVARRNTTELSLKAFLLPRVMVALVVTPCSNVMWELTPWSRVLLEKPLVTLLVKKFPVFYRAQNFITVFTRAREVRAPV
jgi:hypothetical protein